MSSINVRFFYLAGDKLSGTGGWGIIGHNSLNGVQGRFRCYFNARCGRHHFIISGAGSVHFQPRFHGRLVYSKLFVPHCSKSRCKTHTHTPKAPPHIFAIEKKKSWKKKLENETQKLRERMERQTEKEGPNPLLYSYQKLDQNGPDPMNMELNMHSRRQFATPCQ